MGVAVRGETSHGAASAQNGGGGEGSGEEGGGIVGARGGVVEAARTGFRPATRLQIERKGEKSLKEICTSK